MLITDIMGNEFQKLLLDCSLAQHVNKPKC